jgi:hypothetical protein
MLKIDHRESKLKELFLKEFGNTADLKNKKKAYLQAKIKADQEEMNSIREVEDFAGEVESREVPQDERDLANAKAIVIPVITDAGLHRRVNIETDIAIKGGYIWVRVPIGKGTLNKECLKALTGEAKFVGLNPISNVEITLIFNK